MKPRIHTLPLMFMAIALAVVAVGTDAAAQQSGLPYPVIPPGINSVYRGPHFFDAGVKYMWFDTVKVVVNRFSNPGSVESFNESQRVFNNDMWVPVFEVGRQANNFFDLYGGFSWFSLANAARFNQVSANNPLITQAIAYNLDLSGYQFQMGGRSWFPLWGFGRIATTLGVINTLMPYTMDVTRTITGEGSRFDSKKALFWHFAGYAGVELEVGYRSFYGKTQFQYNLGTQPKREVLDVVAYVNPSGFMVALSGGLRF